MRYNGEALDTFDALVIISSKGTPLPYIRIARLEPNYPDPVGPGRESKFIYHIDKKSRVQFFLIDILGKRFILEDIPEVRPGTHEFIFRPDLKLPAGAYWVLLSTNSGKAYERIMITK